MNNDTVHIILGLVFVGTLLLAGAVWMVWIRDYVQHKTRRAKGSFSAIAALTDFVVGMQVSRENRHQPWFMGVFAALLMIAAADLVLATLILWFGLQ